MATQDEVMKISKKLEKMVSKGTSDHGSALDLLNTLKKMKMTLEVLQTTRIGMTVNNFRKASNDEEVISLAKGLIKSWKKLLPEGASSHSSSQSSSSVSRSNSVASRDGDNSRDSTDSPGEDASKERKASPKQTSFPAKASDTTDSVRLKCRELLAAALKTPEPLDGAGDYQDIAAAIEESIYNEFKNTEQKYKTRIRSRISNLKDAKNPKLKENVLLGYISAEKLATMTAEEMASDDMKQLRAKYTKESIDDHQMAKTGGTTTDLLKCGKCLKRNCTYNQVQTRSADEPMTTFVFCNECGHRWKFC